MGMTKPDIGIPALQARTMSIWDDFTEYTDTQRWTKFGTTVGGESVTNPDGDGGIMTLVTGGTQDNAVGFATTRKLFTFTNLKPMVLMVELYYTEAATNKAAIAFGFNSAFGTTTLADTTYLPSTNFSGMMVYKKAGDTTWSVVCSIGTDQTIVATNLPCQAAGQYQRFVLDVTPLNSTVEFSAWGGVQGIAGGNSYAGQLTHGLTNLLYASGTPGVLPSRPVKVTKAIGSPAAMLAGIIAKAGSANSQTVNVDLYGINYLARP